MMILTLIYISIIVYPFLLGIFLLIFNGRLISHVMVSVFKTIANISRFIILYCSCMAIFIGAVTLTPDPAPVFSFYLNDFLNILITMDVLQIIMILIVYIIAHLIMVFYFNESFKNMKFHRSLEYLKFLAYLYFLCFFVLLLCISNNLFMIYLGWLGACLFSYLGFISWNHGMYARRQEDKYYFMMITITGWAAIYWHETTVWFLVYFCT